MTKIFTGFILIQSKIPFLLILKIHNVYKILKKHNDFAHTIETHITRVFRCQKFGLSNTVMGTAFTQGSMKYKSIIRIINPINMLPV